MKSIKLSLIIDVFFIFLASLFFFYEIFLYNDCGFFLSIFLSVLLSVIISSIYVIISARKGELFLDKQNAENLIKSFNYKLFLLSKKQILQHLYDYYTKTTKAQIKENSILLENENIEIFPIFKPEEISLSDIIWAHKNTTKNYKTLVLGTTFKLEILSFIEELNLSVSVMNSSELYHLLKEKNSLFEFEIISVNNKKKLGLYLKKVFSKKQAKRFLFCGIIITLTSFFSFYPLPDLLTKKEFVASS